MTTARLTNPTGRNTRACVVELGPHAFYFSYETCIAYAGPLGRARRANVWGPTTGRHFRELGCAEFPIVEPEELDAIVLRAVAQPETSERRSGSRRVQRAGTPMHVLANAVHPIP